MEKLQIDFEYLVFAWEDDSHDTQYYLDAETGSVVVMREDLDDLDEIKEEIELQPARFLFIPKPDQERRLLDLSDFIFTVADENLRKQLQTAFDATRKFTACADILMKQPAEMERWKKWRNDAARERARKWLAAHNLEPA